MTPDLVIAKLAERQHGLVARRQLLGRGISRDQVKARLRRGSLSTVHRGVYAVGHSLPSVSRTLLDLAGVLTRPQLERALNEAEVLRLTDKLSVPDLLERYPKRAGSVLLRALFRDHTAVRGITRSKLEQGFQAALRAAGLPLPRLNASVSVQGRFFEVDCLWAEQRLIVELDGRESHGTDLALENDRERDRLLLVEGWRVTRVTWRQLRDDAPAVIADLRELLRG